MERRANESLNLFSSYLNDFPPRHQARESAVISTPTTTTTLLFLLLLALERF